ncbi:hypothetical protein GCM10028801_30290 [Nocardioides maradonensis]
MAMFQPGDVVLVSDPMVQLVFGHHRIGRITDYFGLDGLLDDRTWSVQMLDDSRQPREKWNILERYLKILPPADLSPSTVVAFLTSGG